MSIAYTRKSRDQTGTSYRQAVAFAPEPCSSTSGGASGGPQATTKVGPSLVGTVSRSAGTGHWSRRSRYRCSMAAAPAADR